MRVLPSGFSFSWVDTVCRKDLIVCYGGEVLFGFFFLTKRDVPAILQIWNLQTHKIAATWSKNHLSYTKENGQPGNQ